MNPSERESLRQELLELHFGCHEAPEILEARIAAEPVARALYDQIRAEGALWTAAAKEPIPALKLGDDDRSADTPVSERRRLWRFSPSLRIAASVALALFLVVPLTVWQVRDAHAKRVAEGTVALVVSGPPGIPDAADGTFRIMTYGVGAELAPATVSWVATDSHGVQLGSATVESGGSYELSLPPSIHSARMLKVSVDDAVGLTETTLQLAPGRRSPLVHLAADKPLYRGGEVVRYRAVTLDRVSLQPIDGRYQFRVTNPKGRVEGSWRAGARLGVVAGVWPVPPNAAGGEWKIELRDAKDAFAVEVLPFIVRGTQPPKLAKKLELGKSSYARGTEGQAEIEVLRLASGQTPAVGARVHATVVVDGQETWNGTARCDTDGKATITFPVPSKVSVGDARVVARIDDGGTIETAVSTFIIPTGKLDVAFYPEGGELIAGVPVRIYAEVRDPTGRAADVRGQIVDAADGSFVSAFETTHEGRARFELTAREGQEFRLEFTEPEALPIDLPKVASRGVGLRSLSDSIAANEPLELELNSTGAGPWIVGAFCRGTLVAHTTLVGAGRHPISLAPAPNVAGVLRVTVFDRQLVPVAERLVHRRTNRELTVDVTPRAPVLPTGGTQNLGFAVTDESGKGVSAILGVSVHDAAVASMGGPRVGLRDRVLLFGDVDPEALESIEAFVTGGADRATHIDLFLGTRGWRRFAWRNTEDAVAAHGDRARRLLALEGRAEVPLVTDSRAEISARRAYARVEAARDEAERAQYWFVAIAVSLAAAALALGLIRVSKHLPMSRRQFAIASSAVAMATVVCFSVILSILSIRPEAGRLVDGEVAPPETAFLVPEAPMADGQDFVVNLPADQHIWLQLERAQTNLWFSGAAADWPFSSQFSVPFVVETTTLGLQDTIGTQGNAPLLSPFTTYELNELLSPAGVSLITAALPQRVREYAHTVKPNPDGTRHDFSETVYWNAILETNAEGKASVEFDVGDQLTTWNVAVDAHGNARVGQVLSTFRTTRPLTADAKIPDEVTAGDVILLPISVRAEDPDTSSVRVTTRPSGALDLVDSNGTDSDVPLDEGRGRTYVGVRVGAAQKASTIELVAKAGAFKDSIRRTLRVVPRGFPRTWSRSGVATGVSECVVPMPTSVHDGTLEVTLKLYPSPLSTLEDGMTGMLTEPHGCFEQTSSSNYPNVLALQFMKATSDGDSFADARARGYLDRGYRRLASFEVEGGGFDWYGRAPAHVALTAYGLAQFHDMADVHPVDADLLARTRDWLLSRRDGTGGFRHAGGHSFGAAPLTVLDAYTTWSLATTGTDVDVIATELDRLERRSQDTEDGYELAVVACALREAGRTAAAAAARRRLALMQRPDGSLTGSTRSVTSSRGRGLAVETTGFAVLAWLGDDEAGVRVENAIQWLLTQRAGNGTFGSTQATVMALKALTAYARHQKPVASQGELVVEVNRRPFAKRTIYDGQRGVLTVKGLDGALVSGNNSLLISVPKGSRIPWTVATRYISDQPADDPGCAIELAVALVKSKVEEGKTAAVQVTVNNLTDEGHANPTAVIGLPSGLHVTQSVLEDLKKAGRFAHYEVRGRSVVLYWDAIAPGGSLGVTIDAVARVPGTMTGAPSRAWLYYEPDQVRWVAPITIDITPVK